MSDSFETPWTIACQVTLSMGFRRQEHWSGLSFPSPEALPDPGIKPQTPALAGGFFTAEPPGKLDLMFNHYTGRPQRCCGFGSRTSHKVFGFLVHIRIMFTLHCSLLSVQ